jgi:hypothetical protein
MTTGDHSADRDGPSAIVAFASVGHSDPSVRARIIGWRRHSPVPITLSTPRFPFRVGRKTAPGDSVALVLRNAAKLTRGALERSILSHAAFGIYEIDDGLPWDNGLLPGIGARWKVPFRRDRIALRAAQSADRIIVGNEILAEWARDWHADVVVVPTCVEPDEYARKTDYEIRGRPRILWMGSKATERELIRIAPALREVHRRTGATVEIVSAPNRLVPEALDGIGHRRPWSLSAQRTAGFENDIGIMPLDDAVYQRAKCGYKLLQYAVCGLPAVASPIGVNATMCRQGIGLATEEDQWVETIERLIGMVPSDRKALADTAYQATVDRYSYSAVLPVWRAATSSK